MRSRRVRVTAVVVVAAVVATLVLISGRRTPDTQADAAPTIVATTTTAAPPTTVATPVPPPTEPPATDPPPPPVPHPGPPVFPTRVATATHLQTKVYASPGGAVRETLPSPVVNSHMPLVFDVIEEPTSKAGPWLHVSLRARPNGSTGYVKATDVKLTTIQWSIDVDVTARWITVYQGATVWLQTPVVTGVDYAPTPTGDFFVTEYVKTRSAADVHGPYIVGLSAHSDTYAQFDGGDGQIGIHGTNQPYLMGSAASHGCVRLTNEDITRLVKVLPMGTPVHIHL